MSNGCKISVMYIKLRVITDSKKELIEKISDDTLRVNVKEPAEMNRANSRVLTLMKEYFKTNDVRLISGHHSPSKIIAVEIKD